ncbi:RHS repeat-associated core domain-containing protein [Pandoraea commovens]|uniref:tRNA(Glu)-specific nuclease WapA n=1 Tax=Pandoraea commovens TaxID=2508289 RepID=A0ABY5QMP4_9BURK|nr:RHS repeat-associated core domain-containing protein [Pandoraea commovens]UVA81603.1 hypothetical protein NTU39_11670 [Pandoraea commovens]
MSAIKHFSGSAQLAFETYADLNRKILISPQTGEGILRIPIAGLFADVIASPSLMLALSCKAHEGDLNIVPFGVMTVGIAPSKDRFTSLPLCDGRSLNFELESGDTFNGGDFLSERNGDDVVVYHKNGACETFVVISAFGMPSTADAECDGWVCPTRYVSPSGRSLKYEWKQFWEGPRVTAIDDDDGRILEVEWVKTKRTIGSTGKTASAFQKAILFPNSDQEVILTSTEVTTSFGFKQTIEVAGATGSAKTIYYLENHDGQVAKFEVRRQTSVPSDKAGDPAVVETSTHTESMEFNGNRIVKHTLSPGGGIAPLVESYKYETGKTTVTCTQEDKTVLTRVYTSEDRRQTEAVTAAGVTVLKEQSVSIDEARGIATHKSIKKIGGVIVDELTLEYDAIGNLVKSTKDDTVTEWTYFNNYNAYTVVEKATNYQDTSFFGLLLKALDYVNPIGLGFVAFGSGGLTWGTKIDTTVDMAVTDNNYAKTAFQLPYDMNYPGDPSGLTSHVESEIVYRKNGDKLHPQRLTYFSYLKFIPKTVPNVSRPHVPLPHRKLTVLQPSYEEVDVSAEQLKVAKDAAKALLDSLAKQCNSTSNKDDKAIIQTQIDDLNRSLTAQSKTNARGFQRRILVLKNDSPSCLLQQASTTIGDKTTDSYSFELRDQAGTVFASVDLASKAVTYYRYSPYGYRNVDPGSVTWLGFKGEPLNYVGFYHLGNGYRHYDPEACRFQTPDSMSPFGAGGCAAYVYCGGDPVNYHDPSGHAPVAQYSRLSTMPAMYTKEFRIVAGVFEILAAPFTAGTSLAMAVALIGIAAVSGAFSIASTVLEDSDPELSDILGYLGMGLGVVVPNALQSRLMGRAARLAMNGSTRFGSNALRARITAWANKCTNRVNILHLESISNPIELQAFGPHLERIGVFSSGSAEDAFHMGGAPVPDYFSASAAQQAGVYTGQEFNVNPSGRGDGELIGAADLSKNYYEASTNVPNSLLSRSDAPPYIKDVPALAKLPVFDASEVRNRLSYQYGVDVSSALRPVSLEQAMNTLRNANYVFTDADGLFCRNTLSTTAPGFAKAGISSMFDGVEWWKGARMLS